MAAIPIWIHDDSEHQERRQTQQQKLQEEQRELEREPGQLPEAQPQKPQISVTRVGTWLGRLALLGLASPFIQLSGNPLWGAMGLLILFFGIRIAWRISAGRPLGIYGPFTDRPTAP